MNARLILILGVGALLPPDDAFAQSPPPGPQVPALTLPPTSPLPGGIIAPQLRQAPKGIPGFYDPATGRFAPSVGSAPKSLAVTQISEYHFDMIWKFDSALKPWNTVNCTIEVETSNGVSFDTFEDEKSYSFSVGNPPAVLGPLFAPYFLGIYYGWGIEQSVDCTAEDDSGQVHNGDYSTNDYVTGFISLEM